MTRCVLDQTEHHHVCKACGNSDARGKTKSEGGREGLQRLLQFSVCVNGSESKVRLLLLETACRLKESLLLGVMGGGPGEEEELEEEEGGPGDTERRRSPPIWLRTWLLGLWGRRGLIWVITHKQRKEVDTIRDGALEVKQSKLHNKSIKTELRTKFIVWQMSWVYDDI